MTRSVAILLFEEAEVLDFAGPFEVFFTASRIHRRLFPASPPPFDVFTIAEQSGPVATRGDSRSCRITLLTYTRRSRS